MSAIYAIWNLQDGMRPSYRVVDSAGDIDPAHEQAWTGDMPDAPIWDNSLNDGAGDIREMTAAELAAYSARQSVLTQRQSDQATVAAFGALNPALATAAQTAAALQALFRLNGMVAGDS